MENFNLDGDVIDYPDQYLRLLMLKPDQFFLDEKMASIQRISPKTEISNGYYLVQQVHEEPQPVQKKLRF